MSSHLQLLADLETDPKMLRDAVHYARTQPNGDDWIAAHLRWNGWLDRHQIDEDSVDWARVCDLVIERHEHLAFEDPPEPEED